MKKPPFLVFVHHIIFKESEDDVYNDKFNRKSLLKSKGPNHDQVGPYAKAPLFQCLCSTCPTSRTPIMRRYTNTTARIGLLRSRIFWECVVSRNDEDTSFFVTPSTSKYSWCPQVLFIVRCCLLIHIYDYDIVMLL